MSADKLPVPPGKFGTRWVQTILMSVSLIVGYCMRLSISMALVAMTDETMNPDFRVYNWNSSEKSWILSSFIWGYALAQIPSGYLASTWSPCKLFSIGFFLSSVVTLLTPFLADYGFVVVCASRVFIGLAQACFLSCMHVLTSKWAPPLERSRISTYISSGTSLGTVLAMALSGLIADSSIGWPGIFYIFGGAGVIMSIIFYFNVTDSPALHPTISQEEKNYIMESLRCAEDEEKNYKPRPPWRKIITSLPMWGIIFAHMGTHWGSFTIQTEIPEYVKSVLNFNMTGNGFISSGFYVAAWIMSFPYSWLADYAVMKGVSVGLVRRVCNTIAMWGAAAILIILCFVDTLGTGWPISMLIIAGALQACTACGFNVNHIDLSPNFAGAMYSVSNCLSTFASIIAPLLCGAITQGTKPPPPWGKIMTSMSMWGIIFAHMGTNWGSFTIQTEIPEYVKSVLKFEMTQNGLISSAYYVTAGMMCFPYSWLADYAIVKGVSVGVVRRVCNSIAMWGAAVVLVILCFVDTLGSGWPIAMLVLAGACKACTACGYIVNHIDLSPNFAGAMYAVSNCLSTFVSIMAPFLCGAITQDTHDPGPWHTVFFITAGIYFVTNLLYILFAQGETQPWNEKFPDPIKRLSVISLYDTKILTSVP